MLNQISENKLIDSLVQSFSHSENQINKIHESDSEIIIFDSNEDDNCLAATIDSIVEEIETGLYDSPYLWGWMAVMANLSDLAAVGAEPFGLLISETLPKKDYQQIIPLLQKGIDDACRNAGTFILGGDTSFSDKFSITGTAFGRVQRRELMQRRGCRPGDYIFTTSKLGRGNAYAITRFVNGINNDFKYLPCARLKESRIIRNYASACMDTSDGLISTLDQLMRINDAGMDVDSLAESIICSESAGIANSAGIAPWLLLAGQHGEFELVFTVPQSKVEAFIDESLKQEFYPVKLGKVIHEKEICLNISNEHFTIDSKWIRNLASTANSVQDYISSLIIYDKTLSRKFLD